MSVASFPAIAASRKHHRPPLHIPVSPCDPFTSFASCAIHFRTGSKNNSRGSYPGLLWISTPNCHRGFSPSFSHQSCINHAFEFASNTAFPARGVANSPQSLPPTTTAKLQPVFREPSPPPPAPPPAHTKTPPDDQPSQTLSMCHSPPPPSHPHPASSPAAPPPASATFGITGASTSYIP